MWLISFFLISYCSSVKTLALPEYIKSCYRNDPHLNDCALKSGRDSINLFAAGDPSRGLRPLDPLHIPEIIVHIPDKNGLKILFKDNDFKGLSHLYLSNIDFNLKKKIISAEGLVSLDVKNKYELSGKILLLPISSHGDSSIKLKNTTLNFRMWYEHVTKDDGKIYWSITRHDVKFSVEKAIFRLENLLGDKNIGDQINNVLNQMSQEVVADVGPSLCDDITTEVVKNIDILLNQVPFDELMPE
ncbi:protein takeout-like [Aricia agestis]|uniref:protein takeout-like n=1 Tax=Aricia agestis TaxID=91739 RepID=UPI001C2017B6|nr:protein takeout-like [Aricia agestis]